MSFVRSTLNLSSAQCHCWTDSTVTLAWLSQSPSRWKTFVAHRVNEVQTRIPDAIWHHVPTQHNPADHVSRGITVAALKMNKLWWQGPEWLKLSSDHWPNEKRETYLETDIEKRNTVSIQTLKVRDTWDLASRYSSWPKLLRVTAYLMHFVHRLRARLTQTPPNGCANTSLPPENLSVTEYQKARLFWIRVMQNELFLNDSSRLQSCAQVERNSKLVSLNPFLDERGIIRVGGRLKNSNLPYNAKHPIIMGAHPLFTLIIQHAHIRSLHAGNQLTLHVLREEFWIIRARQTVRAVLYRCVKCTRERAALPNELMGNLPKMRVRRADRTFLHCGLDYAGPILIKMNQGRRQKSRKAYISLFVCMTVRAVHLELVSDLTTDAFLAAFTRFCSRRGKPTDLYSDNAKNFRGADRELAAAIHGTQHNSALRDQLSCDGIRWHFIPPTAPHFGGLWEAGVRSVKHHLKRVLGSHTLTFEEMATLLCRIEACLNSRPLTSLSDNLDDYSSLTPGHFLIGSSITAIPPPTLLEIKETRLTRWQLIQQMTEIIWKAWSNDYLHSLQQRAKWRTASHLARVGRLVIPSPHRASGNWAALSSAMPVRTESHVSSPSKPPGPLINDRS